MPADPVFNDFYFVPPPEPVAGNPLTESFGAPDSTPAGITIAFGVPVNDYRHGIDDATRIDVS